VDWYLKVIKNYVGFTGRARRKEYWMFCLFYIIIGIAIAVVESVMGLSTAFGGPISSLYSLALFLPSLGVAVRRLHDTGRSGWWILINIVPILGWLVFLYFMVQDSQSGANKWGANPKTA
jgi:uncharacterized membrane protein YhaH (DUF805 family)